MTAAVAAAELRGVTHVYRDDRHDTVTALREVDLIVHPGEAVALIGPSGAGKSTLLTLLAGLVRPTSGRILVGDQEVNRMSERALLRMRAREIGTVLQTPGRNLLPYATALQNVVFAHRRAGITRRGRTSEALRLLDSVGLAEHVHRPGRLLSGGQQQRLAIAVALASHPSLLLADEPTSQLPRATGDTVVELLLRARDEYGAALLVVTHDSHVSNALDTTYRLADGSLHSRPTAERGGR
ncbi:MAG TPA: ABC transporter ATP-binding protein [Marmoricola sp.]|jgi:ABC-type lipoprotein export system ATPase subunit|nr:ABC transporter ATP-binding protein [Marmoricola sp.]